MSERWGHILCALVIAAVALWVPVSTASDEVRSCDAGLSLAGMAHSLERIDRAVLDTDRRLAVAEAEALHAALPCLDRPVDRPLLARFAARQALLAFWEQDEIWVIRWGTLAQTTAPVEWDDAYKSLARMIDNAPTPPTGGDPEGTLAAPKHGVVLLDGLPLTRPLALAESPHLVQVLDRKGRVVDAFWQDGAAFPHRVLGPRGDPEPLPREWAQATTGPDALVPSPEPSAEVDAPAVVVQPPPPAAKPSRRANPAAVGLLAGGGALALGGTAAALATWRIAIDERQPIGHDTASTLRTANVAGWSAGGVGLSLGLVGAVVQIRASHGLGVGLGPGGIVVGSRF